MAGVERVGLDDIKAGYDLYTGCPYYALFETKAANSRQTGRLIYPYKGGDREEGWKLLEQNLQVMLNTAPTIKHIIQFYDKLGKHDSLDDRTACSGSLLIRMKPADTYMPAINGIGAANLQADNSFLNYLQTELHLAKEKIEEQERIIGDLEADVRDLEEDAAKPAGKEIGGIIGQIGQAGNEFPWMQDIIKDGITFLKHTFSKNMRPADDRQGHAMAGVSDQLPYAERLGQAQNKMLTWYAKTYGDLETQEGRQKGAEKFADDMMLLANLTADDDMMHLVLKKLRATA